MSHSRLAGSPVPLFDGLACSAIAISFFGEVRVFWRKFVPRRASWVGLLSDFDGYLPIVSRSANDCRVRYAFGGSLKYCADIKTGDVGQVGGDEYLSINHNASRAALVSLLLFLGRPIAVVWFVVPIVVAALYARASGTLAHVGGEITKRFPPLANRDASASIIAPLMEVRVSTSVAHALPDSVKGMRIFERHDSLHIRPYHEIQGD